MSGPVAALLADGERLHLQHGPIDLIIGAEAAEPAQVKAAFRASKKRFETILQELVDELPLLRSACPPGGLGLRGPVARRMESAVLPFAREETFITPMAAVAGAVAEEVLDAMLAASELDRAYVNDGGDIALHLAEGRHFDIEIAALTGAELGRVRLDAASSLRGIATSGKGGRSLSFGIADSVTVIAPTASTADAAATLIANAVDLPGHALISREPAVSIFPDSDLGEQLVVTGCGRLNPEEIADALDRGAKKAERMIAAGLIAGAALFLQDANRVVGVARPAMRLTREEAHA
jgi:ApbE superfamily uncharacterized protein (UPF0280 family)